MKLNITKAIFSSEVLGFYVLTLQNVYYKSFTHPKAVLRKARINT